MRWNIRKPLEDEMETAGEGSEYWQTPIGKTKNDSGEKEARTAKKEI